MELKLIVIRTGNPGSLAEFYSVLLGLTFDYHKHGNSPYHYSASVGQTVLEVYPLTKSQMKADDSLRLGFSIDNFEATILQLKGMNIKFVTEPTETEWGYMAVIQDPDGRKIELYKS